MKKILSIILVAAMLLALSSCGASGNKLSGTWTTKNILGMEDMLMLANDGTFMWEQTGIISAGSYIVDNDKGRISFDYGFTTASFDYTLADNSLSLTQSGTGYTYERKSSGIRSLAFEDVKKGYIEGSYEISGGWLSSILSAEYAILDNLFSFLTDAFDMGDSLLTFFKDGSVVISYNEECSMESYTIENGELLIGGESVGLIKANDYAIELEDDYSDDYYFRMDTPEYVINFKNGSTGSNENPSDKKDPDTQGGNDTPSGNQNGVLYKVKVLDIMNVRDKASTGGKLVKTLRVDGTEYDVYEEKQAEGYLWRRIGDNQWIADDGTWVEKIGNSSASTVLSEEEVKSFLADVFGNRNWYSINKILISAQELRDNYSYLDSAIEMEFFCDAVMDSDFGRFSKNKKDKDYASWVGVDEMVKRGILTQNERNSLVEMVYQDLKSQGWMSDEELELIRTNPDESYMCPNEYVRKEWLQSLFDYYYGKGAINVGRWSGEYYNNEYFFYTAGGVGGPMESYVYSRPVIESLNGSTATVTFKVLGIDDENMLFDGISYSDISYVEDSIWNMFGRNAELSEVCRSYGIPEDRLTTAYLTVFKDSTGVHMKGYTY